MSQALAGARTPPHPQREHAPRPHAETHAGRRGRADRHRTLGDLQESVQRVVGLVSGASRASHGQTVATVRDAPRDLAPRGIDYSLIQVEVRINSAAGADSVSCQDGQPSRSVAGELSVKRRGPTTCTGQAGAGSKDSGADHEADPHGDAILDPVAIASIDRFSSNTSV